jgi:hypothetical protein
MATLSWIVLVHPSAFSEQKLQDEKRISSSELAKDPYASPSEQMAYNLRYATGKKDVTLGVLLLQQDTIGP